MVSFQAGSRAMGRPLPTYRGEDQAVAVASVDPTGVNALGFQLLDARPAPTGWKGVSRGWYVADGAHPTTDGSTLAADACRRQFLAGRLYVCVGGPITRCIEAGRPWGEPGFTYVSPTILGAAMPASVRSLDGGAYSEP